MTQTIKSALDVKELYELRAEKRRLENERDALRMENIAMRDTIAKYQFDNWHLRHLQIETLNPH